MVRLPSLVVALSITAQLVIADHPIAGVLSLLQKLTVQAKEEGATELVTYNKFKHWCTNSEKSLNKAIGKEKQVIDGLNDQLDGLNREIDVLGEDIKTLTEQIEEQETIGLKADALRKNQSDLYVKTYKNLDSTITAVDDAVEVMEKSQIKSMFIGLKHSLRKAKAFGKQPEEEWQPPPPPPADDESQNVEAELANMDAASNARKTAWSLAKTKNVAALSAATSQLKKAEDTAAKGGDDSDQLPDQFKNINLNPGAKNPFKKNKVKVSTSHEGEVIETFQDMEGGFQHDKLDVHDREQNAQQAYMLAKQARDNSIKAAKENKEEKIAIKSDKESEKATATQALDAETKELVSDSASLDSTVAECKQTTEAWNQRSSVRSGEIEAMGMAMKILQKVTGVRNPDEHEIPKKALAVKAAKVSKFANRQLEHAVQNVVQDTGNFYAGLPKLSFLQESSDSPKERAAALLRTAGAKAHSGALQKLAQQIQAFDGPFDKMKAMIQKMIFHLVDEQKDEDEHKHWCDLELSKNEATKEDKEDKISMYEIKVEEMNAEIKLLTKDVADLQQNVADTQEYMKEETEIRQENKAEIELTIKDSLDAQNAVGNAISVLKDFYKESGMIAKEPWEFLQVSNSGVKLPEKPGTWDASYTGVTDPKNGADGVLSLLDEVAAKFSKMEAEARLQDNNDQKDYEKDMQAKKILIADDTSIAAMKAEKKNSVQGKLESTATQLKATTKENDAVVQYLKDLEPACAPGEGDYEARKQARTDEITALRKAQTILEDAFRAKA